MYSQVVLSVSSPYFQEVLQDHPSNILPTIILPPEVDISDLMFILQFVYLGSVEVPKSRIASVLKAAAILQIKGLYAENPEVEEEEEVRKLGI